MRAPGITRRMTHARLSPRPTATFVPLRHTASQAADFASGDAPPASLPVPSEPQDIPNRIPVRRPASPNSSTPARGAAFSPLQPRTGIKT